MKKEKIQARLFFMLIPYIKFQDPTSNSSWLNAKRNGQAQTNMPPKLLKLGP